MELINLSSVKKATTLSVEDIQSMVLSGVFPKPVRLNRNRIAWVKEEIQEWIKMKVENHKWNMEQEQ